MIDNTIPTVPTTPTGKSLMIDGTLTLRNGEWYIGNLCLNTKIDELFTLFKDEKVGLTLKVNILEGMMIEAN